MLRSAGRGRHSGGGGGGGGAPAPAATYERTHYATNVSALMSGH